MTGRCDVEATIGRFDDGLPDEIEPVPSWSIWPGHKKKQIKYRTYGLNYMVIIIPYHDYKFIESLLISNIRVGCMQSKTGSLSKSGPSICSQWRTQDVIWGGAKHTMTTVNFVNRNVAN